MVKNSPAHAGDMKCGFNPWVGKIPWRRAWQPTPVFLPGESRGQGPWCAMIHRVAQSRTLLKWLSMHVFAFLSKNSSIYSSFSLTSLKQSRRAIWETVFWAIVLSKSAKLNVILNFKVVDFPFCQHTGPYWNTLSSSPHSPALLVLSSWQQWPPSLLGQLSESLWTLHSLSLPRLTHFESFSPKALHSPPPWSQTRAFPTSALLTFGTG